jgi:hypothetical protein
VVQAVSSRRCPIVTRADEAEVIGRVAAEFKVAANLIGLSLKMRRPLPNCDGQR